MGSLKKMDIDGSNVVDIAEDINWFNMLWYNIVVTSWPNKLKYLEGKEVVTMRKYFGMGFSVTNIFWSLT